MRRKYYCSLHYCALLFVCVTTKTHHRYIIVKSLVPYIIVSEWFYFICKTILQKPVIIPIILCNIILSCINCIESCSISTVFFYKFFESSWWFCLYIAVIKFYVWCNFIIIRVICIYYFWLFYCFVKFYIWVLCVYCCQPITIKCVRIIEIFINYYFLMRIIIFRICVQFCWAWTKIVEDCVR